MNVARWSSTVSAFILVCGGDHRATFLRHKQMQKLISLALLILMLVAFTGCWEEAAGPAMKEVPPAAVSTDVESSPEELTQKDD